MLHRPNDVSRLDVEYGGDLLVLAEKLALVDVVYDQEMEDGELHEYAYGALGSERVEAFRKVGGRATGIFRLGSPMFFASSTLQLILKSLEAAGISVVAVWARTSLDAGTPVPVERFRAE